MAGIGSVIISKDITLFSVLYVFNLDCNLLLISKITIDLNCVTKFLPHICVFQDLNSGRMIGNVRICSGLYLLKKEESESNNLNNACSISKNNKDDAVML